MPPYYLKQVSCYFYSSPRFIVCLLILFLFPFFFVAGVIQDFSCWCVPGMEQWHMQISQQRKLVDQCQRRKRYMQMGMFLLSDYK